MNLLLVYVANICCWCTNQACFYRNPDVLKVRCKGLVTIWVLRPVHLSSTLQRHTKGQLTLSMRSMKRTVCFILTKRSRWKHRDCTIQGLQ